MTIQHPKKNKTRPLSIRDASPKDIPALSGLIARSYQDVARAFELTKENCPTHPSNCSDDWIKKDFDRGVTYSVLYENDIPAGCAALEKTDTAVTYLERLAVLPIYRHKGFGKKLVTHSLDQVRQTQAEIVSIGIIAEQEALKKWYERLGFVLTGTKKFDHLPFTVGFMQFTL